MSNRFLLSSVLVSSLLLCACQNAVTRQYGMDYDATISRAGNLVHYFGLQGVPSDTVTPSDFSGKAGTSTVLQRRWIEGGPSIRRAQPEKASDRKDTYSSAGLIEAMTDNLTNSSEENQFFGFVDEMHAETNGQAQKKVVSLLTRSFFNSLRKTDSQSIYHLDLIRRNAAKDATVHSMAVFLENEALGCRYNPEATGHAPIGTCGMIVISRSPDDTKPAVIPFAIGGLKEKVESKRPEEMLTSFLDREDRLGYRIGAHPYAPSQNASGMPFFRWNGSAWIKTDEFDGLAEKAFEDLTKTLPALSFVYHKSVTLANGQKTLPYLIEGSQFDFFFKPPQESR